jgi:hypothetical protein
VEGRGGSVKVGRCSGNGGVGCGECRGPLGMVVEALGKVGEALGLVGGCPGEGPGRSGEGRVGCGKGLGGSR